VTPGVEPFGDPRPSPDSTLEAHLLRLDAEAQRLWQEGQFQAASATFRQVLDRAGGRHHAELAYGDLFALARQQGDAALEVRLWREYLERFPRGRHADEARAGLCRRAQGAEQQRCWKAYEKDFPAGAYRDQAGRSLARPGTSSTASEGTPP
jgi:hypothetical protein